MSESEKKMYLPPEEYESVVLADGGRPLAEFFPNGILVSFKGDEMTDVQDGSGISRGLRLPSVKPEDRNPEWSGETE